MKTIEIHLKLLRVLCAGLAYSLAVSTVAGGHQECVGRYELALPGDADVATTTPIIFGKVDRSEYSARPIRFPDDQPAPLSSFIADGAFRIVRGMTLSEYMEIRDAAKKRIAQIPKDDNRKKNEMPTDDAQAFAYFGNNSAGLYLYRNGEMVFISAGASDDDPEKNEHLLRTLLINLRFRQDYEIPIGEGICLPGIFVLNGGANFRDIGVTFRLKSHPDVTIFFKDKTSSQPVTMVDVHNKPVGRQTNLTSREQNEFVWKYSGLGDVVKLDHDPLPFHTVELDGRKGVASFGTITRVDGSTDYGYLATVQGDPNAPVDTPDLTLLVQRTAKYAKGNPPVSKDELKKIAKDIAASIKRRPVE